MVHSPPHPPEPYASSPRYSPTDTPRLKIGGPPSLTLRCYAASYDASADPTKEEAGKTPAAEEQSDANDLHALLPDHETFGKRSESLDKSAFGHVVIPTGGLEDDLPQSGLRRHLALHVRGQKFELAMLLVVLANAVVIIWETDLRAWCRSPDMPKGYARETDFLTCESLDSRASVLDWTNRGFLAIYILEMSIRLFIDRLEYFRHGWNVFDMIIVVVGVSGEVLEFLAGTQFRFFRVLRIARASRLLVVFRELYLMVHGLFSVMKTLFWACLLLLFLTTAWSVFAVEMFHPMIVELAEEDYWREIACERCSRSMSSVMHANLTLFQTIVAGDSWGEVAIPLIERYPPVAMMFGFMFISLALGLLNLVTAVIVDTAASARDEDEKYRCQQKVEQQEVAKGRLVKICEHMDKDHSGYITLQELLDGFDTSADFAHAACLLDVSKDDLCAIFDIMDEDRSGFVTYAEFADQLHKMKSADSKTMLTFIRFYILEMRRASQSDMKDLKALLNEQAVMIEEEHQVITDIQKNLPNLLQSSCAGTNYGERSIESDRCDKLYKFSIPPTLPDALCRLVHDEPTEIWNAPPGFEPLPAVLDSLGQELKKLRVLLSKGSSLSAPGGPRTGLGHQQSDQATSWLPSSGRGEVAAGLDGECVSPLSRQASPRGAASALFPLLSNHRCCSARRAQPLRRLTVDAQASRSILIQDC